MSTPPDLPYREEGKGKAVLLISGGLANESLWERQAQELAQRYRVIRLSLRTKSAGAVGNAHTLEVERLVKHLRLRRCCMAGHGAGALAAANFARHNPQMVSHLALVDPVVRRTDLNDVQEVWHLESLLQWMEAAHVPLTRTPDTIREMQRVVGEQTLSLFPKLSADEMQVLQPDLFLPPNFACPVLILMGEYETPETVEMARVLFGRVPDGRLRFMRRASRKCPIEAADEVTHELQAFFSERA